MSNRNLLKLTQEQRRLYCRDEIEFKRTQVNTECKKPHESCNWKASGWDKLSLFPLSSPHHPPESHSLFYVLLCDSLPPFSTQPQDAELSQLDKKMLSLDWFSHWNGTRGTSLDPSIRIWKKRGERKDMGIESTVGTTSCPCHLLPYTLTWLPKSLILNKLPNLHWALGSSFPKWQ